MSGHRPDSVLRVRGGRELNGRIPIGGSKNASLPILTACLLTSERVRIRNLADVTDTKAMLDILRAIGCEVEAGGTTVAIKATSATGDVPVDLAGRMRASIVLLGPLLARTGQVRLPMPGGDAIGRRRIELHLNGLWRMGAEVEEREQAIIASARRLRGARIVFDMPTVTGTENVMMAAVLAEGRTEVLNAAREPHVQDLARFLTRLGARIEGAGTEHLVIDGVDQLGAGEHTVTSDYLEAGTYAMAVGATGGEAELEAAPAADLDVPLLKLQQAGIEVEATDRRLRVARRREIGSVDLITWVHPGFATDLQPQYMALMSQARGRSVISEYIFENRFQHVGELRRMGAEIEQLDGRTAVVHGPRRLRGSEVAVPDIRSGAALVIAALCAEGESTIHHPWHVDRGYPDLVGKLASLGADISRETAAVARPAQPGHDE
jgi:UDP-N-acetylglucosamine 1-carboxyvinyltransferase